MWCFVGSIPVHSLPSQGMGKISGMVVTNYWIATHIIDLLLSPQNYQELFNLHHAKAQNIVEQIIGVCKKRFKVLVVAQEYDLPTQAQLVSALAVVHNFIYIYNPEDLPEDEDLEDAVGPGGDRGVDHGHLQ